MIEQEKKYFADPQTGGGNYDDADFAIGINQSVNSQNVRIGTTDAGRTKQVESIGSTKLLTYPIVSVTYYTIGVATDIANYRFCYFQYNTTSSEHRIMCWDADTNTSYVVLLSSQVYGGLNFDKDYLIHSARIVNGLLYWTDNLNRQRKVNIDAGIKLNQPSFVTETEAYTSPMNAEVISLLKRPPLVPLNVAKTTQPSLTTNQIKNGAFQFMARYYYKDGETSVISVYSLLAEYNSADQTFNAIDVSFDFTEKIDQDVALVDMVVRLGNTNNFYVIRTWDKRNASDLAAIQSHNAGISALTYRFLNDKLGEQLDPAYALKPFDSVPVLSKALEIANERLFLGNNLIGYDAPAETSLTAAFNTQSPSSPSFTELYLHWNGSPGTTRYIVVIPVSGVYGYYESNFNAAVPLADPTAFTDLQYIGASMSEVFTYYGITPAASPTVAQYASITITGVTSSVDGTSLFKTDCPYQLGIVFYDFGDRKCGVVTSPSLIFTTEEREPSLGTYSTSLDWSLDNTNALTEIPDWATHYSIVLTKALRTRFFLQAKGKNITYATKDADGAYVFNTATYAATNAGIAVDITLLNSYAMGYTFNEGDLVKIFLLGNVYNLSILAQDGNWIICELKDIGSIGDTATPYTTSLFEIYTPYQQIGNEPFYEQAQTFPINNAGESTRAYSVTAGSIVGDVYILTRNDGTFDYFTENMSPNDKFYRTWYTNEGRANFVTYLGQTYEPDTIAFSETFIIGSRVNGLSSFDALNEKNIPLQCGEINKLQITSKVQDEQGIVMLAICAKETASLYLGEVQQYGSNKQTTLTIADEVIGTVNILKGSFGTINPESVVEYRGLVFWIDILNGRAIQYSAGGLFPISNYNATRFWRLFSEQYLSMSLAEIEALGSRPFIFGMVDPYHDEVLFAIPKLLETPPEGYLPDYPDLIYPFDIWDGQAKTIVYNLNNNPNFWMGSYSFTPDYFTSLSNKLYSFKNGNLYLHNQTNQSNNFYGVQYTSKLMCVSNKIPQRPKVFYNISSESNLVPLFTYFYNDYPELQTSDLLYDDYNDLEGIFYATIRRNKVLLTEEGYTYDGLMTGDNMRNVAMRIMIEYDVSREFLALKFLNIGFTLSRGHTT